MHFILLKFLQKDIDFLAFCHIQRRPYNRFHTACTAIHPVIKVLLVNNTGNIVDRFLIYRKTGVPGLIKHRRNFLLIRINGDSRHVNARGCDIHGFQLRKFDGAFDQASFLFINSAILFCLLHDGKQFLLRYAGISRSPDQE